MSLIMPTRCGCAFRSSTLDINGRGTSEAPYVIELPLADFVGRTFNFATGAERTANLPSPLEGDRAFLRNTDRMEVYNGSTWERIDHATTAGRTGLIASRSAVQSVNSGTLTALSFDTEFFDSDTFLPATPASTITVPAGLGGLYSIMLRTFSVVSSMARVALGSGPIFDETASGNSTAPTIGLFVALPAGETLTCSVQQTSGSAQNFTAAFEMYRLGP